METIVSQVTTQWLQTTGEELDSDLILDVLANSKITSPDSIEANEEILKTTLTSLGVPARIVVLLKKHVMKLKIESPKTEELHFLPPIEVKFEAASVDKKEIKAARDATRSFIISSSFATTTSTFKISVLKLLQRVLCNVIEEPLSEKYRKLPCDSKVMKESLGRLDLMIYHPFLTSIGFKLIRIKNGGVQDMWFLQIAKIAILETALELVNSEAIEECMEPRIPSKSFNPLNAYSVSTNSTGLFVEKALGMARESYKVKEYDDIVQQVTLMEEYFISGGEYKDISEDPLWIDNGKVHSPNVDDCMNDHEINELVLDDLKRLISTKPTFKSRRKTILKQLEQRKIYKLARIRFILSDNDTREAPQLEISVHLATTIKQL